MPTVTLTISEETKLEFKRFPWVNWSEAAREELVRREERLELLEKVEAIVSKSMLSEEEADRFSVELGREIKKGRFEKLKKLGVL